MHLETMTARAGHADDPATGAVTLPIHLSTTFELCADGTASQGYSYAQAGNPTRDALERCLAELEGGIAACAFASGSAATVAVFQALPAGSHVLVPAAAYFGTADILRELFEERGIEIGVADMTDAGAVRAALRTDTALVWIETPSNPGLAITDIAAVASLAHEAGALVACDNTLATPILQRPLEHGADLVVHSTSKALSGHNDVLGGAVIAREDGAFLRRLRRVQTTGGAVPSPFECWLTLRGIRTLPLRVRAQSAGALDVATFLDSHPAVERVWYPGLGDHPGHALAARQMDAFGGVILLELDGVRSCPRCLSANVRLFTCATSLGGAESLVEQGPVLASSGDNLPDSYARLSIGLEHPDDLIADLAKALEHH